MTTDDAELLRRYAAMRDESAFAELVRRYLDLVYFAALRQVGGDAHRAEDVTQTVFTLLARKASSLTRHQTLAGWLHMTTRYAASEAMRTERRRRAREQEAHLMHELFNGSASDHEWERLRPVIDEALSNLGDADREAVLLRFFANLPFAEVGAKLNLSENTARMRVERALEKLHVLLAKRGVTSTSAALAAALANQAVAVAPSGLASSVTGAALSGAAAAGAGSLAAVIAFMSASKITLSLAAAGALAIGTAVYQSSQARMAAVALADASRDHAALTARFAELETGVKAAEKEKAEHEAALTRQAAAKPAATAAATVSPDAAAALARNAKYEETLAELGRTDPEMRKASVAKARTTYLVEYRPLFQSLGFTPEQCEKACDVLEEQLRLLAERRANGTSAANRGENPAANLWAQFGPDVPGRVAQFQQTRGSRDFVNDLSARLYFLDEPISAQQAEQLVQVVDGARPASRPQPVQWEDAATRFRRTLDWDAILARAGTVLSPTQLQGLQSMAALAAVNAQLAAAANESVAPKK